MPDNIFSDTFGAQLPQNIQDIIDLLCKADEALLTLTADAKNMDLSVKGLDSYEKLLPLLAQINSAYTGVRDTMANVTAALQLLDTVTQQYGNDVRQEVLYLQQLQTQMQGFTKNIADLQQMQQSVSNNKTAWQQLAAEISTQQGNMNNAIATTGNHVKALGSLLASARNEAYKGAVDMAKARFELQQQTLEQEKQTAKAIYNDHSASLQQRLDAYRQYETAETQLAGAAKEKQIALASDKIQQIYTKGLALQARGKMTPDLNTGLTDAYNAALLEREAAYEQYNTKMQQIAASAAKNIMAISNDAGKQILAGQKMDLATHINNDEQAGYAELLHLQDRLTKGEISLEDYTKKMGQLDRALKRQELQDAIDSDREALENDVLTADERLKIKQDSIDKLKQLAALQMHTSHSAENNPGLLQQAGGSIYTGTHTAPQAADYTDFTEYEAAYEAYTKKKESFENDFAKYATQLAQQTSDAIVAIQDNEYEHEAQLLDKEERTLVLQNAQKIAAINASTGYAITKQNELTQTNAQATAQENAIEAQKKELSIRKAKFDKAASIASIVENTALAIIKAWVEADGDPAVAIPLSALIAGIGAAQLAKAASTPIPQYASGTEDHTGGYAIVGEAGEQEWIQTPAGKGFWSRPTATLYDLPPHTTVTPISDMISFATTQMMAPVRSAMGFEHRTDVTNKEMLQQLTEKIGKKFADTGRDIVYAIKRQSPGITININDGYRQKSLK